MGYATRIGKYSLGRIIGVGTFAKVKLGVHAETNQRVAVKIIDKKKVLENKLIDQVKREISAMKLLHHPNIVRIYEVIATKTKIYLIMEYISGGQLLDKMSYLKKLNEKEARKYFQQLIDAMDYCHARGVYHRDLKPENLLLDHKGNLKVTDFGFSVLKKPGDLLSTACGSPSYVAPEVMVHKGYDGAAAAVWSCGVILFESLAGYLPFEDRNLMNMYRKISRADFTCPPWFTAPQKRLLFKILDPLPTRRATIAEILEDDWFQTDYEPSIGIELEESMTSDNVDKEFNCSKEDTHKDKEKSHIINAFQLIAMSNDLDLSGLLLQEQENDKQKTKLGSRHSIDKTIEIIEAAARGVSLSVQRMNNFKVKLHENRRLTPRKSLLTLSAEVIELTPTHCVVEISKSAGDIHMYKEFCKSLSSVLTEESCSLSDLKAFMNNQREEMLDFLSKQP